jgi:hypothetical protein
MDDEHMITFFSYLIWAGFFDIIEIQWAGIAAKAMEGSILPPQLCHLVKTSPSADGRCVVRSNPTTEHTTVPKGRTLPQVSSNRKS